MSYRHTRLFGQGAGITELSVAGYKSIRAEQTIAIAPLTILAGANSSGKSSMIQPLLLLKQTLEANYDPGPLLLSGANVRFTEAKQLFYRRGNVFQIALKTGLHSSLQLQFTRTAKSGGLQVTQSTYSSSHIPTYTLTPNMTRAELKELVDIIVPEQRREALSKLTSSSSSEWEHRVERDRCFLELYPGLRILLSSPKSEFSEIIESIIHIPGLRGNPERTYPVSAVGGMFPGTFEHYTASLIDHWGETDNDRLRQLGDQLAQLGLTWKVEAKRIGDTQVELRVGRTRTPQKGGDKDMVSVADVGFGVSQTLPVLVALLTAQPGQFVYLEQPEIHLHPRAQVAMAAILAAAAKRGVRVVIETHSALLLLAVQTLIAEGELSPEQVKLHWFQRNDAGETTITTADLDDTGAFGDLPIDFADVSLGAEQRYLDIAETKLFGRLNGAG